MDPTSFERQYEADEAGTLEHLLDVCQDAALGARLAGEIFTDADPPLAAYFRELADSRDEFSIRLAFLIARAGGDGDGKPHGTFRGKLFHWRLRLAKHLVVGESVKQDRRAVFGVIRRGSDYVLKAYEEAEQRPMTDEAHQEVLRQAALIRQANQRIYRFYAETL